MKILVPVIAELTIGKLLVLTRLHIADLYIGIKSNHVLHLVFLPPQYGDTGRRNQFTDVKLGLDVNKFFSDPQYQDVLMRQLLEKKRVERYIGEGLKDNPAQPCGNYIGYVGYSIQSNSNEYKKIFSGSVGHEVHYSNEMLTKREKHKQYQEEQRQEMIARKQAEIDRLQKEIDTLSK